MRKMRNCIFKYNYLHELPDDIKQLIYKRVYKDIFSTVLKELHSNIDNLKYYNILKYFINNQEEPKLNILNYLSRNIYTRRERSYRSKETQFSLYKSHLTSNVISKLNINKLKIPSNIFMYLDKKIAQPFINSMQSSINNMYIDDSGVYFVLEYDRYFSCFAEIFLILLSFWKYIRRKLYEFYELHKEAYRIHIKKLIKDEYRSGLYLLSDDNINDVILDNNFEKIKRDNNTLYKKIVKHRSYVDNTESFYVNFEICNIIENYSIENNVMIIRLLGL
jgi:hypothetical protein